MKLKHWLIFILLGAIWMTGAFTQDEEDRHQNVGREIQAQEAEQAGQADAGEPIAPGADSGTASAAAQPHPDAQVTPGDAPAGDPRNDAQ